MVNLVVGAFYKSSISHRLHEPKKSAPFEKRQRVFGTKMQHPVLGSMLPLSQAVASKLQRRTNCVTSASSGKTKLSALNCIAPF